ncbi:hypothetical protein OYE22_28555 [Streptomyces sp. 71268]|uniref:hypothetical protein n=1 Tax=Streptomyces sp. 71268 TaxID=3002640 RepID=UPI0023F9B657|nr:hypothetical protein [Streptomyces sp. 71268]WEV28694.1 hypothetical protein OYE22_28555 [Streptomyces sp. 71268]
MASAYDLVVLEGPPSVIEAATRLLILGCVNFPSEEIAPGPTRQLSWQRYLDAFAAHRVAHDGFVVAAQTQLNAAAGD